MDNNLRQCFSKGTLIAAHRGVAGGNVPFNTLEAFEAALQQGADIIEMDVIKSADGRMFIFHPKQEKNHLNLDICLTDMTTQEIRDVRYVNFDRNITEYGIPDLDETLEFLKGRCLINLDHGWEGWFEDMISVVRRHNMQGQVLIKTPPGMKYLKMVEELAHDFMYMPVFKEKDEYSEIIEKMDINYVGSELVFSREGADIVKPEYIALQKQKGRFLWVNAILYSYKAPLSAGHFDDVAVTGNPDEGWGWLLDRNFDIIQTDWPIMLRGYLDRRNKLYIH
jgi:glycerophosphoryl diester phosphodiesterase